MTGKNEAVLGRIVLSDQIKEWLIKAILNGEFKSGDRIVTSALAKQWGVSQAPVREAIRDLVLLGFLENVPFRGTSVRSFTSEDLQEVYQVRAALEALSARLAAERMNDEDVQALRMILDEMIKAAQEHDETGMVFLDNQFHETIMKIAGNKVLLQLWKTLQFGYWTIVSARISSFDLEHLAKRHDALLEALKTRDPQKAADAMRRHIEELGKPLEMKEVKDG